jgi:hypothetical protein
MLPGLVFPLLDFFESFMLENLDDDFYLLFLILVGHCRALASTLQLIS